MKTKPPHLNSTPQIPRRISFAKRGSRGNSPERFDYDLDYRQLDLRQHPELYRVGVGEQGVLMVEPYKSEILPHWKFKNTDVSRQSAEAIEILYEGYKAREDFVGMDMSRKFLQMGFTRSRRYANHRSGQKYDKSFNVLPRVEDPEKAKCAEIFFAAWKRVEADEIYADLKMHWKAAFG